jgi:hypothetical protein
MALGMFLFDFVGQFPFFQDSISTFYEALKVKQYLYRPRQALRVPGC